MLTLIAAQARISPRRQQQVVVLEPDAVRKLPPGNFLAMGTFESDGDGDTNVYGDLESNGNPADAPLARIYF